MDADVEMVVPRRVDDEVGFAEDLNTKTITESLVCRRNLYFTLAMLCSLFAIFFLIFTTNQNNVVPEIIHRPNDEKEMSTALDKQNKEATTHTNQTSFQTGSNAEGSKYSNEQRPGDSTTSNTAATLPSSTSKNPTASPNTNVLSSVQDWLESNVTLKDGAMYQIVQQMNHDRSSFTEGLTYCDSQLYESVGMQRSSALLVLDPRTGETMKRYPMDNQYFGEGLTCVGDRLIQLTYQRKKGFVYDRNDLSKMPSEFNFDTTTGEGWGLTYDTDRHELIVSDGSKYLHFWDPDTLIFKRKIPVVLLDGNDAHNINELEYWRGRVIANVWYRDVLLVIHPQSGLVEKEYDMSSLWSKAERSKERADVLNGISVAEDPDMLYITGKYWDRTFLVKLLH